MVLRIGPLSAGYKEDILLTAQDLCSSWKLLILHLYILLILYILFWNIATLDQFPSTHCFYGSFILCHEINQIYSELFVRFIIQNFSPNFMTLLFHVTQYIPITWQGLVFSILSINTLSNSISPNYYPTPSLIISSVFSLPSWYINLVIFLYIICEYISFCVFLYEKFLSPLY